MALYGPPFREIADGPEWDVFCLVCGGPSLNPAKLAKITYDHTLHKHSHVSLLSDLPHLFSHASALGWLDQCIGIPEDNVLLELGLYDHQGDFKLPGDKLFGPYPSFAQAARTGKKVYGLNCHARCYQLLQDRLGYKLRYQDIWPKLAAENDDSECLNSAYGGITVYHEHLFEFDYMDQDQTGWMLLDPTENKQNAERILTVWRGVPEARRPALVLSVYCSFKRAAKLTEAKTTADENGQLWASMARVPSSVLRTVVERAYWHPDYLGPPSPV